MRHKAYASRSATSSVRARRAPAEQGGERRPGVLPAANQRSAAIETEALDRFWSPNGHALELSRFGNEDDVLIGIVSAGV